MDKNRRIKNELSVILNDLTQIERRHFITEIESYLYIENRKISDIEMEKSIQERNQHVYSNRKLDLVNIVY